MRKKFNLRMFFDVGFDLIPDPFIISDFLAVRTDGNNASKCFYLRYGSMKIALRSLKVKNDESNNN